MMRVEFETIAADEAPVQPIADRLRFRLEFALLMLSAGRIEEAGAEFDRVFELIDAARRLIPGPRPVTTEPPAQRRGFSFALRRSPPGPPWPIAAPPGIRAAGARARAVIHRRPIAAPRRPSRDPAPPEPEPGSTGRAPRAVIRRRPMSPGAPAYRVNRPPPDDQLPRRGEPRPGPAET
jgi:hypothetical protein